MDTRRYSRALAPLAAMFTFLCLPLLAGAAPAAEVVDEVAGPTAAGAGYALAVAIAIGLAAVGGGLGQGRAAAAALEGITRNPNSRDAVFVPMLLGLAFIESLVIFALVIAFALNAKF